MKKLNATQMENLQGGTYSPFRCARAIMLTLASMSGDTVIDGAGYAQGIGEQATWCMGW